MKILIADDEPQILELIERMVARHGECETVASGKAALEAFRKAHENGVPFDLITLDIFMPDMDGFDALLQIREMENDKKIPADRRVAVIMVTGSTQKENIIKAIQSGCNEYISKPFNRETIENKMVKLGLIKSSDSILREDESSSVRENENIAEKSGDDRTQIEIESQIETIELTLVKDSVLGFDPAILFVLDDVEIGQGGIEKLKAKLGTDVFIYLFNIANSAFHGSLKMGPVKHFFDVVNRLGMQYTKVLILLYAMHRLARGDHDAEIIFAKSFSAAIVGRIMARGFGFRDDGARKVELACLLANLGALMMTVYRNRYHQAEFVLSDEFIEQNHLCLTERIMRRFQLPRYLDEMILTNCFVLDRMEIGLPTVVKLAISSVDWSFRTLDNKLVFRSPYVSLEDRFTPSLAGIIEEQFVAAGLKKYLVILSEAEQMPQKMY